MELAKRNFQRNLSYLAECFSKEDVRNNLNFLTLLNIVFINDFEPPYDIIQVIDPDNHENMMFYTHNKFLEVYDRYGLDGFIS